ncbi:Lipopolysaccharide core heptosyltransferase I [hydrothermal vent metagenome]|uniref:Lipopolysaccharide heptosyltransferase 1 n=1 Tax=hydrothermal vent metagenome TaxID=652676 RepID=A0A3B1BNR7_9ZZZZ
MQNIDSSGRVSILLVKTSSMGDVIHTFPVARAIKKFFPDVTVDWVVAEGYTELVRLSPYVDNIYPFRRKEWGRWWSPATLKQISAFIRLIRGHEYDAVIDLQGLLRSGLISLAARAPVKIGFAYAREGASFFYNRKVGSNDADIHAIDRYMQTLLELGIEAGTAVGYDLAIPQAELDWAEKAVSEKPFVAINPNARWETKRWPIKRFAKLAKELHKREGLRSVIIGGPEDIERGKTLADEAGDCAIDLTNAGGFGRLAAILHKSSGLITNDSGPMHLAVALGTPTVAIFGPTNPKRTGPYGMENAVTQHPLQCAPCYKRVCPTLHECMEEVMVEGVISSWDKVKKR